jgi:hypothetical protein
MSDSNKMSKKKLQICERKWKENKVLSEYIKYEIR